MGPQSYSHKGLNSANSHLGLEGMQLSNHFYFSLVRSWAKDPVKLQPDFCSKETARQYMYVALYCLVLGNLLYSYRKLK